MDFQPIKRAPKVRSFCTSSWQYYQHKLPCLHDKCSILIIDQSHSCACKYSSHTQSQKLSKGQWISLKNWSVPISSCFFWLLHVFLFLSTYIRLHGARRRRFQRWQISAHLFFHKFSCDFYFSCVMLVLKLEVTAYDCFRRTMMQSWRLNRHWTLYFIIYNVHAFPKSKWNATLLTFKEKHRCVFMCALEAIQTFFEGANLLSTLPYQWAWFSL